MSTCTTLCQHAPMLWLEGAQYRVRPQSTDTDARKSNHWNRRLQQLLCRLHRAGIAAWQMEVVHASVVSRRFQYCARHGGGEVR